jgi:cell division transport system ATP-binding protein
MSSENIIELTNASIYQRDNLVLSEVDFSLKKGEFLYLIGRTGSGKSSLLKTLYGELPLKEGEGRVDEFDLKTLKPKKTPYLRRKIGIVFQDFQLLTDRDIRKNLLFVLKATGWKNKTEIEERILEVLKKVNLEDKLYKMPSQLSGGEQQRIVIARAMLNHPDIILADEPTGNLDPETSEEILNILMEIKESGTAILMATHNYNILKKFQQETYKCEKGKLLRVDSDTPIDFSLFED